MGRRGSIGRVHRGGAGRGVPAELDGAVLWHHAPAGTRGVRSQREGDTDCGGGRRPLLPPSLPRSFCTLPRARIRYRYDWGKYIEMLLYELGPICMLADASIKESNK